MANDEKKDTGRPTKYSESLADEICCLISQGDSIRQICLLERMPYESTIYRWLIKHKSFCEKYARAKEAQMEKFNEDILDIADDSRNDWIEKEDKRTGKKFIALNEEHIARSKIRIEARKWLMGKHKPNKYGDKVALQHSGSMTTKVIKDDIK